MSEPMKLYDVVMFSPVTGKITAIPFKSYDLKSAKKSLKGCLKIVNSLRDGFVAPTGRYKTGEYPFQSPPAQTSPSLPSPAQTTSGFNNAPPSLDRSEPNFSDLPGQPAQSSNGT